MTSDPVACGWLASASVDTTVRVWPRRAGGGALFDEAGAAVLRGHTAWVNAVAALPRGDALVSGGGDRELRV